MVGSAANKRSRESQESEENRNKNIKTAIVGSPTASSISSSMEQTDQYNTMVAAFTECMKAYKLEDKIESAVKKSFADELDQRLVNMATKADMKNLQEKLDKQSIENTELKEKLIKCETRLERFDKKRRTNNLIFSNVALCQNAAQSVYQVCNQNLKIEPNQIVIKDAFVLKTYGADKATILVEFSEGRMVAIVFKHIKNLAGSKIRVEKDMTEGEQEKKKKLLQLKSKLLETRSDKRVFVSQNTIKIGTDIFELTNGNLVPRTAGLDMEAFFSDNYDLEFLRVLEIIN